MRAVVKLYLSYASLCPLHRHGGVRPAARGAAHLYLAVRLHLHPGHRQQAARYVKLCLATCVRSPLHMLRWRARASLYHLGVDSARACSECSYWFIRCLNCVCRFFAPGLDDEGAKPLTDRMGWANTFAGTFLLPSILRGVKSSSFPSLRLQRAPMYHHDAVYFGHVWVVMPYRHVCHILTYPPMIDNLPQVLWASCLSPAPTAPPLWRTCPRRPRTCTRPSAASR
jgi:hypothetical protein